VLTLLYDKTFPPRPATASNTIGINKSMGRLLSAGGGGTGSAAEFGDDMLRQFNYYGQVNSGIGQPNIEDFTEQDIAKLE
jgi:hypothetical protein